MTRASQRSSIAFVIAIAIAGCHREPQCQGKPSNEEVARIRDLASRGAAPCPEHHDPTIVLGAKGIELQGRVLATTDELPRDGFVRPIGALFKELDQNRQTWQRVRPGQVFDGQASIEISPKTKFVTGASAITTAVRAGYVRTRIVSGDVSFDATCEVPGSPKTPEPSWDLYIDQRAGARYDVTLKQGNVVVTMMTERVGVDGAASWVESTCSVSRCDVIIPRLEGEFQTAAALLRRVLGGKSSTQRPPKLRFEG